MPKINLIYLSPWNVGGFATFTAHMYHGLKAEGWDVNVLRCNKDREEGHARTMKHHGTVYQNVTVAQAVRAAKKDLTLITAVARPDDLADEDTVKKLFRAGAYIFVQSTQEFKQFPHLEELKLREAGERVLVIRERLQGYFKRSKYVPHPYVRSRFGTAAQEQWVRRKAACSIAMIATNKHPYMLCDANQALKADKRIVFLGKETTHFLRMNLMDRYRHYKPGIGFVGSAQAVALAKDFRINVDLSVYSGDGGGTQYSFLEAMDAGCINILHKRWAKEKGDMEIDKNCYVVTDAQELVNLVENIGWPDYRDMRRAVEKTLDNHHPSVISKVLGKLK